VTEPVASVLVQMVAKSTTMLGSRTTLIILGRRRPHLSRSPLPPLIRRLAGERSGSRAPQVRAVRKSRSVAPTVWQVASTRKRSLNVSTY
jgi:hypothetical protein